MLQRAGESLTWQQVLIAWSEAACVVEHGIARSEGIVRGRKAWSIWLKPAHRSKHTVSCDGGLKSHLITGSGGHEIDSLDPIHVDIRA